LVERVAERLFARENVVIHCKGGLGRTGLAAACVAIAVSNWNMSAEFAIKAVREARRGAIENEIQAEFVRRLACRRSAASSSA
jgi:protein-tyrosine phosphatase